MDKVEPSASSKQRTPSARRSRKRAYKSVPVACNECRRRKTACDGSKPICNRCQTQERTCVYEFDVLADETRQAAQTRTREDATQQLDQIANTLNALRSTSDENEVVRLSRYILSAPNPIDALLQLKYIPGGRTPSPAYASKYDLPRPSLDREYELARWHPIAYPCVLGMLQRIFCNGFPTMTDEYVSLGLFDGPTITPLSDGGTQATYTASIAARLANLDISGWTRVKIQSSDAIMLITEYLNTEHLILSLFDTELFITDLLSRRSRFCSELLIVSILFTTCQSHALLNARFRLLRDDFLLEARRLWLAAQTIDSVTTLAASQLLVHACAAGGIDDLREDARYHGDLMWQRLNSFGLDPARLEVYRPALSSEELDAMAHVVWSTFNIIMLFDRYYGRPPPEQPPAFPLPTKSRQPGKQRSSVDSAVSPIRDSFEELSRLRMIEHEIRWTYSAQRAYQQPISDFVPLQFVVRKYAGLLAWSDELDEDHQRSANAPYHVLVLHMWYHVVLMDLFRPFVNRRSSTDLIAPAGKSAEYLFVASLDQLKALVITLRFRQPFPRHAILWHTSLVHIVNCVLRAAYTATDRLFYFRVCVESYFDVLSSFPLAFDYLKLIVALAVHEKIVDIIELRAIWRRLQMHDRLRMDETKAAHLVDLDLNLANGTHTFAEMSTERLDALIVQD